MSIHTEISEEEEDDDIYTSSLGGALPTAIPRLDKGREGRDRPSDATAQQTPSC